jgi:threonine-phosphate decarboxylase
MTSHTQVHGGQLRKISDSFGIPLSSLLDFSANINPDGPPLSLMATLHESLSDQSVLADYPDLELVECRRSIAEEIGVPLSHVIVSNGFVPLLQATLKVLPITSCLLPVPAFSEYRRTLSQARINVVPHRLKHDLGFEHDMSAMLVGNVDAILLANPQNPSGVACDLESILHLVRDAARSNTYVLLDEAFIDYIPNESVASYTASFPKLIVFRSVTKFYGCPGLRIAYAVAHPDVAARITQQLPPWPVTTLATLAVSAALHDQSYSDQTIRRNLRRRTHLEAELKSSSIHTYKSAANFLLLRLPLGIDSDLFWELMITQHRIVLRSCADYEGLPSGHLRVAVRKSEANILLVSAMRDLLSNHRDALSTVISG